LWRLWSPAGPRRRRSGAADRALRAGGNVIVCAMARPIPTRPTPIRSTQRPRKQRHLNDNGRAAAKAMGEALRTLKVPVGQVTTSVFYRASRPASCWASAR
jgi:hypothetical protein